MVPNVHLPRAAQGPPFNHYHFMTSYCVSMPGHLPGQRSVNATSNLKFARTKKRSVYMEPNYSAFICSKHCSFIKYARASKHLHALLAVGKSSSWLASPVRCLHGKIFVTTGRGLHSLYRELSMASYPVAPCKHFTRKPIISY